MTNSNAIPPTLEPAITPAFLAQLEQLSRQRHPRPYAGIAWSTFLFSALARREPQPAPRHAAPPLR